MSIPSKNAGVVIQETVASEASHIVPSVLQVLRSAEEHGSLKLTACSLLCTILPSAASLAGPPHLLGGNVLHYTHPPTVSSTTLKPLLGTDSNYLPLLAVQSCIQEQYTVVTTLENPPHWWEGPAGGGARAAPFTTLTA